MVRAEAALDKTARRLAHMPVSVEEAAGDRVDLGSEMLALLAARIAYRTNLRIIETGDELQRSTLDLLA